MATVTSEYPYSYQAIEERSKATEEERRRTKPNPATNAEPAAQTQISIPIPIQQAASVPLPPKESIGFWEDMQQRGDKLMNILSPDNSLKSAERDHLQDIGGVRG